ncbi:MAG: hypothetical protein QW520_01235 [Methanomassiliicoccales archaeon]
MILFTLLVTVLLLLMVWVIISFPLYLAARVVTDGRVSLGAAMLGTLLGSFVFYGVYYFSSRISSAFLDRPWSLLLSTIIALLAFLALYKFLFRTTWGKALLIAVLAVVITLIAAIILLSIVVLFGLAFLI